MQLDFAERGGEVESDRGAWFGGAKVVLQSASIHVRETRA